MKKTFLFITLILIICFGLVTIGQAAPKGHFSDVRVRFFVGGDPGDQFASVVYKGALDAEKDLGCKVDYVFSGWDMEKMTAQFRDAVAAKPDGIAMMGHPGDDALMSLVDEAYKKGIQVVFQNVDCPKIRKKYGCGYVGADLYPFGYFLGSEAVKRLNLKKGDRAAVFGIWTHKAQSVREEGSAVALEDAGLIVDRITRTPEMNTDPLMALPSLTGYIKSHPDVKLINYGGGQVLGATPTYMDALGKKPGEIYSIGFDLSPAIIDGFKKGYVQMAADQLPYLQGYLPIMMLCQMIKYGMPGLYIDTGSGIVDKTNWSSVGEWANKGIR